MDNLNASRIEVDELSGEEFGSLEEAQAAALPSLAGDLAATLRRLLKDGNLEVKGGMVIFSVEIEDRFLHG